MYFSTVHWLRVLNGYTSYAPLSHTLLMRVARQLPDPEALETLVNLVDVGWILVHLDAVPEVERLRWMAIPGLEPAARFGLHLVLRVTRRPSADWRHALLEPVPGHTVSGVPIAPLPEAARAARLDTVRIPERLARGAGGAVAVRVTNLGPLTWPGLGLAPEGLVVLAVGWEPEVGDAPAERTVALARDLPPGESTVIRFDLRPPAEGRFRLTIALRQEGAGPFPAAIAPPLHRSVEVGGA
jgi:hypothetical protein